MFRRLPVMLFAFFSLPLLVFALPSCNSSDPCKCLCGVPFENADSACAGEIFYREFGGATGPSPNSLDAEKGGCSADWCVPNQAGKRCSVTSKFFGASHSNISIIGDLQQPSLCTGKGIARSAPSCGAPSASPKPDGVFKPPEKPDLAAKFPKNENQSAYDQFHEFVYGYPATVVNVTNITHLTVFPQGADVNLRQELERGSKFIVGEMVNVGYGVIVSSNPLDPRGMQCTGPSLCECEFPKNFSGGMTLFQCTFYPFVNGTYSLYVRDVYGNDNSKFTHAVRLVPDQPPELVYAQPHDRLVLVLLAIVVFGMLLFAFAYYWRKVKSGGEVLQKLRVKKAQVEDDLKAIQYRFMKRDLTQEQYLQQYGAKQAELSQVVARLKEEEDKQQSSRRRYRLPF